MQKENFETLNSTVRVRRDKWYKDATEEQRMSIELGKGRANSWQEIEDKRKRGRKEERNYTE